MPKFEDGVLDGINEKGVIESLNITFIIPLQGVIVNNRCH